MLEQFTAFFGPERIWRFGEFGSGAALEGEDSLNLSLNLRGGWSARANLGRQFARFDPDDYVGYEVVQDGAVRPYDPLDEVNGLFRRSLTISSPTFRTFNASIQAGRSEVPIFAEASEGRETGVTGTVALRPHQSIRVEGTQVYARITRSRDGSEFARTIIPRVKVEYQPTRALFFRIVSEYRSERQAALFDPAGRQLFFAGVPASRRESDGLRMDYLLSFEPTPGTVAFIGYGGSLATDRPLSLRSLHRQSDGFFVKLAYLFRR